ncbi:MAG: LCP family protein [Clostridiales bacterium]|nr:LCP family protein [Clostridiales bacterium]
MKTMRSIFEESLSGIRLMMVLAAMVLCCMTAGRAMTAHAEESTTEAETDSEASAISLPGGEDIYSILLIGSDRREDNWNGNSDVMIVMTVNTNTQKIILTSFMRDLYADIPGYGVHKLNYAYAAAGADKLIETLEESYDIDIDNYAAVDFDTMAEIIDLLGGVDVALNEDEVEYLNQDLEVAEEDIAEEETETYTEETSEEETEALAEKEDTEEQTEEEDEDTVYHLTGAQAVLYMRIRYVGNADYERTQRQRNVLAEIFENAKEMSAAELTDMAQDILELADHDISALDMISLLGSLSGLTEYELVENRIPYDGLFTSQDEMLVPDFEATIEKLHEVLYE